LYILQYKSFVNQEIIIHIAQTDFILIHWNNKSKNDGKTHRIPQKNELTKSEDVTN
jgi:hypothetical protein